MVQGKNKIVELVETKNNRKYIMVVTGDFGKENIQDLAGVAATLPDQTGDTSLQATWRPIFSNEAQKTVANKNRDQITKV